MGGKLFPGSDIVAERWRTVGTTYRFGLCLVGLGMVAAFAFGALITEAVVYEGKGLVTAIVIAGFAFLILVSVGQFVQLRAFRRYRERTQNSGLTPK